jgi:glutamine synthetase
VQFVRDGDGLEIDEDGAWELIERAKKDKIDYVNLQFVDLPGMVKSVTVPANRLEEILERGVWFDGSSVEGFARIAESDMYLKPDPSTYLVIPWQSNKKNVARLICDVHEPDGKEFDGGPRAILKRAVKEVNDLGYVFNTGPELEFFLMKRNEHESIRPTPHDSGGYFDLSMDQGFEVRKEMVLALEKMGVTVETTHHEVAMGQHEIDFKYDDALRTADKLITMKFALKSIATQMGLHATFMPKPVFGINGSGMHVHESFFSLKQKKNAFYDAGDKYHLSELAYHFIAGQLLHAREICGILAPLVNSYKRLVPGYEAPVYISWARINRSALIRIPKCFEGRESSTRIEIRCSDSSSNPYLAFACLLKAGLDGIKRKLEPPDPIEENLFEFDDTKLKKLHVDMLPGTLGEALSELQKSRLVKETLGEHAFNMYAATLKEEWINYCRYVSEWEIERYLQKY